MKAITSGNACLIYLSRNSDLASSYLVFVLFGLAGKVHSFGLTLLVARPS